VKKDYIMNKAANIVKNLVKTLGVIRLQDAAEGSVVLDVKSASAGMPLTAGDRVGIVDGVAWRAGSWINGDKLAETMDDMKVKVPFHGIVDPFLTSYVKITEHFWVVSIQQEAE